MTRRSFALLRQTGQQYSGILLKAKLTVRPVAENELLVWISDPEYAQIQKSGDGLEFFPLELSKEPALVKLKNGVVSVGRKGETFRVFVQGKVTKCKMF